MNSKPLISIGALFAEQKQQNSGTIEIESARNLLSELQTVPSSATVEATIEQNMLLEDENVENQQKISPKIWCEWERVSAE